MKPQPHGADAGEDASFFQKKAKLAERKKLLSKGKGNSLLLAEPPPKEEGTGLGHLGDNVSSVYKFCK